MQSPRKFLVVDDNADGRSLLTRTLHRKFPKALTLECVDAETAVATAKLEPLDAIVVHRAGEMPGLELVSRLRQANPKVPILAISGFDRSSEAVKAGATRFINYDQWLLVGTVVAEMVHAQPSEKSKVASSP